MQDNKTNSHHKLAQAVQDAALLNINEDVQSLHDQIQEIKTSIPDIVNTAVETLSSQLDETLGRKVKDVEQAIINAKTIANDVDRLSEEVVKKAARDFEATKLTFIEALNGHINQRIEPVFKSIEKSQKEIDKAVKVSEMARQGFTFGDLLLVMLASVIASGFSLVAFWSAVKLAWI